MGLIKDESTVKPQSQFLKYEAGEIGNTLILKSHLYELKTHFLKSVSRSVECRAANDDGCLYCSANYPVNREFRYLVFLNGQKGFIDIKGSVFFAIQRIAKAQKKDTRSISWTVIKEGDGLQTKYTVSKDDNLSKEDWAQLEAELDDNTKKLVMAMEIEEEKLSSNYAEFIDKIKEQAPQKQKAAATSSTADTDVDPDGIPFQACGWFLKQAFKTAHNTKMSNVVVKDKKKFVKQARLPRGAYPPKPLEEVLVPYKKHAEEERKKK